MKVELADVWSALRGVDDPEMPINIVDLGIVADVRAPGEGVVEIDVLPTFIGCPALPIIQSSIERVVGAAVGAPEVRVRFVNDPPWSVDRISSAGRESLRRFGVSAPQAGAARPVALTVSAPREPVACPFCGATRTELESAFGPTRCKMIYYCEACRNSFEHLKRV